MTSSKRPFCRPCRHCDIECKRSKEDVGRFPQLRCPSQTVMNMSNESFFNQSNVRMSNMSWSKMATWWNCQIFHEDSCKYFFNNKSFVWAPLANYLVMNPNTRCHIYTVQETFASSSSVIYDQVFTKPVLYGLTFSIIYLLLQGFLCLSLSFCLSVGATELILTITGMC